MSAEPISSPIKGMRAVLGIDAALTSSQPSGERKGSLHRFEPDAVEKVDACNHGALPGPETTYYRLSLAKLLLMGIAATAAGCVSSYDAAPPQEQPPKEVPHIAAPGASTRKVEVGLASWFRPSPRKRHTADGKRYDEDALIAAHRTLPFNTIVRVTNIENGRSVELRIADRGPHVAERIIDVSSRAASELDMKREGIVPVQVEVIAAKDIKLSDAR